MTNEEEVLATKLALVGIGIWSQREWGARTITRMSEKDAYAIVTLDSIRGNGEFFFEGHHTFYPTRMAAMEAAMKLLLKNST
jgi:hypothetical protein